MEKQGFIALVAILIILAVALLVGVSVILLAVSESAMSLQKTQSSQAYYLAILCSEDALMKLKEDTNYSGNETVSVTKGSCQILPVEGNWTIKILADYSNQVRKIKIAVSQINPAMVIDSWQEVADF